jgi:hypothetical protein
MLQDDLPIPDPATLESAASSGGLFTLSPLQIVVGVLLAGGGVAALVFAATTVIGGSDGATSTGAVPTTSVSASSAGATVVATTVPEATPAVVAVSSDPADHWVIASHEALSDANGDLVVVLTFKNPWPNDPPTTGFVAAAQIAAGLEIDGRFYGTTWSNSAGIGSQAEALAGGTEFPRTSQQQPLVEPELWVTPEGRLAIHMPGDSPTGGVPAVSLSPSSTLLSGGRTWSSFGADPDGTIDGAPLGPIAEGGSLPGIGWIVAVPDVGTTTLTVPDTSS